MKKLIIFDLDGTLLNTIADLARSGNYALKKHGFPIHDEQEYKFFVGNGIKKLLERALPENERTEENLNKLMPDFLAYYNTHNNIYSTPYPGIKDLLEELQSQGFLLAIASNKYQEATDQLVAHYFPTTRFIAILGQREHIPAKPNPHIVTEIIDVANVTKEEVLYIGDSGVDMETTKNAEVTGVGVTWGFRPKTELEKFNPDHLIDTPQEVIEILRNC